MVFHQRRFMKLQNPPPWATQGRIKPSGPHAKFLRGPFSLLPIFSSSFPTILLRFVSSSAIEINYTLFSVLNLRSTTYSKKLIAALHTLTAFCSCKCVNNVTKLNKEVKGWRKMDQGIVV